MTNETPITPTGPDAIRAALKTIPHAPGVYRMLDAKGRVLYVGKAKDLAKRVTSYALARDLNTRILRMVSQVSAVEITTTQNEAEALLVEANYIRRYRPHYNILLKDDKSFPYLLLTGDHAYPRLEKHRGAQNKKGDYFGPFASVGALNETMALLQKIFLLRPCADTIFKNRTRPCLQYQIKRCSAPCVKYISEAEYAASIRRAKDFLQGRHRDVQEALAAEMNEASAATDYERAALLRDRIRALTAVQQEQGLRTAGLEDADVIAMARRGARSIMQVFFYRQGSNFGHQSFTPRHEAEATDSEIMAAFLAQFYQAHTPPPEVLVSVIPEQCDLLSEALTLHIGRKVIIRQPLKGDKQTLMSNALTQADAALARAEMEQASIRSNLEKLAELFGLAAVPKRIEVYDNSHIMGTHAVGAYIVATPDGFDKRSYRSFTIKDVATTPGDDYAMMREVFRRRFKAAGARDQWSGVSEEERVGSAEPRSGRGQERSDEGGASPPSEISLPNLVLIDGGLGQLHAVEQALQEINVEGLALVAIAKGADRNAGREWFFMHGREPFQLSINDPLLHYLQRLRDEAHRFAIGKHRKKRSGALTVSALDDIPGIGASRKRALLQHFGSRADVESASLTELEKVSGISKTTARSIYDYFHG